MIGIDEMLAVKKNHWLGVAAVLLSASCFALSSILIKTAYQAGLSPLQVLALQSWIASGILLAYALLFRRDIFRIPRRLWGILALQGLVGSLGTSLLYAYSLVYLPVSVAILLLYLYPVLVLGAGVLIWHKPIRRREIVALLLALGGTAIASGLLAGVDQVALVGVFLGLAAAVCYALFNVLGEITVREISPLTAMSFAQWFSSLGLLLYLRQGAAQIPWQSMDAWLIGIALATVASIFPFYLILVGIKRIGSGQAAILSTFELPMTFILAALILKEAPTWNQGVGGSLVLGGIILLNWRSGKDG